MENKLFAHLEGKGQKNGEDMQICVRADPDSFKVIATKFLGYIHGRNTFEGYKLSI